MNVQGEPSEKRKKTKNSSPAPSLPSSSPSFSLLPDEITVSYLARISISYYPRLSILSKSFRSVISSPELYAARSHFGRKEKCLYVCLLDHRYQIHQWFRLWINPNRTLPNDKTTGQLLVPVASSDFPCVPKSTVSVGSEIYFIGGETHKPSSSAVRILDCRSHTWRDCPSMHVARTNAFTCVHDGKIYVMGGCEEDESWAEVFDTKTQTWECLPDPGTKIRKSFILKIAEIEGRIIFGRRKEMYAYDPKQCKWESCEGEDKGAMNDRAECVIENVKFSYDTRHRRFRCRWLKDGDRKVVKGFNPLEKKYKWNGGSSNNTTKVVGCGGNIFVIWEGYTKHNPNGRKKIWGAEIEVKQRYGDAVKGRVKWVDVVQTVPISCQLLHCLAVSV